MNLVIGALIIIVLALLGHIFSLNRKIRSLRIPSPMFPPEVLRRAGDLVKQAETLDASGEYKKFQVVYSKLQKEFPEVAKRKLALAIELKVNEQ